MADEGLPRFQNAVENAYVALLVRLRNRFLSGADIQASLPFGHEREPDDDDDAAPRAAFGRRIARGITQQQATS